jgi:acyl dehydratase
MGVIMSSLSETLKEYVGMQSEVEVACDVVERGAVRRYAQAVMNEDPIFSKACENNVRYGGPVAPPLFPTHLFRRPFGAPDPIQDNARNPDFDGIVGANSSQALPEIEPLNGYALLNGGSEIEFYRYARHGETIRLQSRYADITEKETSKGQIVLVVTESEYHNEHGDLLMRTRRTTIRRK